MAEGACILSGIGFNGYNQDGSVRWDRVTNVSPIALETAQNSKEYLEAWNQNTNKWLKNYVYLRVTPKGKKPGFGSTMATFITSAVWHGFYPGYYLLFITGGFVQLCGRCNIIGENRLMCRLSPPSASLFFKSRSRYPDEIQEILRLCLLDGHPKHVQLCLSTFSHSYNMGLATSLEQSKCTFPCDRLLRQVLHPRWHRYVYFVFQQ